jgi:hypothetical protein
MHHVQELHFIHFIHFPLHFPFSTFHSHFTHSTPHIPIPYPLFTLHSPLSTLHSHFPLSTLNYFTLFGYFYGLPCSEVANLGCFWALLGCDELFCTFKDVANEGMSITHGVRVFHIPKVCDDDRSIELRCS